MLAKPHRTMAPVRVYGVTTGDKLKGTTSYELGGSLQAKDALAATTGSNGFREKIDALLGRRAL